MADMLQAVRLVGSALWCRAPWGLGGPVFSLALTMLLATSATGQTVASNFEELGLKVKAGDTVYVTDGSDRPEREARILGLTGSVLTVSIDGARQELDESNVRRIRQRLPDSRKNGALIGFLVGAAGSVAGAKAMESPAGSCSGGCVAGSALYGGGLGALVGLGIDALIQGRKDIYLKGGQASLEIDVRFLGLSPTKGLSVSLRF